MDADTKTESPLRVLQNDLRACAGTVEKMGWRLEQACDRIAALEDKWAALDVRLKILENLDAQADSDEFGYFWKHYPRKVGKGHARKSFAKALKKASFDQIMDGLNRYKKDKPDQTDWKHPATWLNSEGWEDNWTDEIAPTGPKASTAGPNTTAAVAALSALMEPAEAVQVRELVCANTDLDRFILLTCADNQPDIEAFFHPKGSTLRYSERDMRMQVGSYRDRITAAANHLGFDAPVWPKVDWS